MTDNAQPPRIEVAIAIIQRDDQVLIRRRDPDVPLGGYWEFPGGKRDPGETIHGCVIRECAEELGIRVVPLHSLAPIDYSYPHGDVRLFPFICRIESAEPVLPDNSRWVCLDRLHQFEFPPANAPLLRQIAEKPIG